MKGDTCFPSFLLVDFLECLNFLIIVGSHFNYFSQQMLSSLGGRRYVRTVFTLVVFHL